MEHIKRREFLRKIARSAPVVAGAGVIAATAAKAQSTVDPAMATLKTGVQSLQSQVRKLDERIDRLEGQQKKWVRIALGAAALSLGIDVGALL